MKKKLILMLCFIMCGALFAIAGFAFSQTQHIADEVDFKIVIDGEELAFGRPVVTVDGSAYLPARELFEQLGYDVYWDNRVKTVAISEKQQFVFDDDTYTSREGTLKSGLKYIFLGTDEHTYSVDERFSEALEEGAFTKKKLFGVEFQEEETIESIAERMPGLLSPREDDLAEHATLVISYDTEIQVLSFSLIYDTEHTGLGNYILVDCKDGTTFLYSGLG